jgi:hypothetical protein
MGSFAPVLRVGNFFPKGGPYTTGFKKAMNQILLNHPIWEVWQIPIFKTWPSPGVSISFFKMTLVKIEL